MPPAERNLTVAGRLLARRLDELGRITDDEPGKLTRTFLSPAMRRANSRVAGWMRAAGLAVREDAVGNLIGRLESTTHPRAKTLLLGSHLDTVRDAGRFDGALGVLLPIVALGELRRRRITLPFAVEIIGFSEEEGVRFGSGYIGSEGYIGRLGAASLRLRDSDNLSLRDALRQFGGGDFVAPRGTHAPHDLIGYVETHIEQGPVLEARGLSVGVVPAIAGQTRVLIEFKGSAGHAGTTPMSMRRDALAGAAEFVLAVENFARPRTSLVATVGRLQVAPGAANVIPGSVVLSLDVRHPHDARRLAAIAKLNAVAVEMASRRKLRLAWTETQNHGAVACSPALTRTLARSVRAVQGRGISLVSGAGHDAVVLSEITPVAMLFVRSRAGLSHHPDEFTSPADLTMALRVVVDFLEQMASKFSGSGAVLQPAAASVRSNAG